MTTDKTKRNFVLDTMVTVLKRTEIEEVLDEKTKKIKEIKVEKEYIFDTNERSQDRLQKASNFMSKIFLMKKIELGKRSKRLSESARAVAANILETKKIEWMDVDGNTVELSIDDIDTILVEAMSNQFLLFMNNK